VDGWLAHKKSNGYVGLDFSSSTLNSPTGIQVVGVVTSIPICDYRNKNLVGINCPNVRDRECKVAKVDMAKPHVIEGLDQEAELIPDQISAESELLQPMLSAGLKPTMSRFAGG
jgi:hypothetical protein